MPEAEAQGGSATRGAYRLFLGNVTSTILLAITAVFVARLLQPAAYGYYSIALITPGYLQTIIQLGLPNAATRYPAKLRSEGEGEKALSFFYSVTLFEGLFAACVMAAVLPFSGSIAEFLFGNTDMSLVVAVAVLSVAGQGLFLVASAGFQGIDRMDKSAALQVLEAASKLAVTVVLVLLGFALLGAIVGYTASMIVAGLVGFAQVARVNGGLRPSEWASQVKEGLRYSFPLFVAALAAGVVSPYQITVLAAFTSAIQIGGFGAATNMTTLVVLLSYPIYTALFPLFSKLTEDREALADTYRKSARYSTVFVVPAVAFMISFARILTPALFGRDYAFAGPFVALSVLQYLSVGFGELAFIALLSALGNTRQAAGMSIANSATIIVASTLLIPVMGVYGAILAALAGMAVLTAIGRWAVARRIGTNAELSSVWRIYLAAAAAGVLVYPVSFAPVHPIILSFIGAAVYLALVVPILALVRAVSEEDLSALDRIFSRIAVVSALFAVALRYYRVFYRSPK